MRKKKLAFLITILSSALAFATITSEGSFSVTLDTQPLLYMVISNTPVESMTFSDMLNSGHDQMTATYQAVSRDPTDTGYRLYVYNNTGGNCTLSVGIDHGLYKDNVDTNEIPWAIYIGPKDNINPDGKPKETSKSIYFASWLINKNGNYPSMTIATNTKVISYPVYVDLLNAPTKEAHTYAGTYTATATITLSTTT